MEIRRYPWASLVWCHLGLFFEAGTPTSVELSRKASPASWPANSSCPLISTSWDQKAQHLACFFLKKVESGDQTQVLTLARPLEFSPQPQEISFPSLAVYVSGGLFCWFMSEKSLFSLLLDSSLDIEF